MFGLIDRAILSPPQHVVDPDRVATIAIESPGGGVMTTMSYVAFTTVRDQVEAVSQAAAWRRTETTAIVNDEQLRVETALVTSRYFQLLGAAPHRGSLTALEADTGVPSAAISYTFWKSTFGGRADVIGRHVTVNRLEYEVAAVMPSGFSGHSPSRVDIWLPYAAAMHDSPGWATDAFRNVASVIVRVKHGQEGAAAAQASAVLERRIRLSSITGTTIGVTERRIAYALYGVSVLVMIIGLANVATLLLVRATRRRRDAAIRAALGASRRRLFVQVLFESVLLAVSATAGALLLASWFDEAMRRLLLSSVIEASGLTMRTVVAAVIAGVIALLVAATVGLVQLPRIVRTGDLAGATYSRGRSRIRIALLLVQTALSVVLIAGAAMFGRSLYNLASQDFGMELESVLLAGFERGPGSIPDQREVFASALERIRLLPGVEKATPIQSIPFGGRHVIPVGIPGRAEAPTVGGQLPFLNAATPEYFEILGIQIVEGRRFTAEDDRGAPVVVVNETMARTVWPGERAVGKCIRIGFDESFDPFTSAGPPGPPTTVPCREVVGVARDVRQRSVVPTGNEARLMQYFVPFAQVPPPPTGVPGPPGIQGLLVRTAGDPRNLVLLVRRAIVNGRTDLPFVEVRPYSELLESQMRPWRLGTFLLSIFGLLAVSVSAIGLFAAFAHAVGERRREMAIRIAVGARPGRVLAMVIREAGRLAMVGAAAGCVCAVVAGRWVQSMLFGTAPSDPLVLGSAAALMLVVAAAASYVPARLASRADPTTLLRAE
jgi:predicted permease